MNEKINKNAKVEKLTKKVGRGVRPYRYRSFTGFFCSFYGRIWLCYQWQIISFLFIFAEKFPTLYDKKCQNKDLRGIEACTRYIKGKLLNTIRSLYRVYLLYILTCFPYNCLFRANRSEIPNAWAM